MKSPRLFAACLAVVVFWLAPLTAAATAAAEGQAFDPIPTEALDRENFSQRVADRESPVATEATR